MSRRSSPGAPEVHDAISASAAVGVEWIVDARGCAEVRLRDLAHLKRLCDTVVSDLRLHVIGAAHWHRFPGAGGVTGLYLLSESHLACHTYPEHSLATFNLYCCRPRADWRWESALRMELGAREVVVHSLRRGNADSEGDE